MKNLIRRLSLLALVLVLSACGSASPTPQPTATLPPTPAAQPTDSSPAQARLVDLEATARQLLDDLAEGRYERAAAGFDAKMAELLPPDKLRETWESLVAQVGPFQAQLGIRIEEREGYWLVYVTTEFSNALLDTQVAIDESGRIAGLFFRPAQATAEPVDYWQPPDYAQPEAFEEREVVVGSGQWALPGTLALPLGDGPFPAVVLVHGSGPNDRDETVGFNKPFRDLAWGLASRGIAVLRYEKRTKEHAEQVAAQIEELTVHEETVEDAVAAVALLRGLEGIDGDRVFVLGHSLGGMVAPRIGALDPEIAGLVVMAGPTRPLEDLFLEQVSYVYNLDGELSDQEGEHLAQIEAQVSRVKDPELPADTPASELPLGIPAAYWLDLRDYDPAQAAGDLALPMFILQGERDYQVTVDDYEGWQAVLAARADVLFELYPTLDHYFVEGEGLSDPTQDYGEPGHVAGFVIDHIVTWIEEQ
jgi:dienelactone hydrolase